MTERDYASRLLSNKSVQTKQFDRDYATRLLTEPVGGLDPTQSEREALRRELILERAFPQTQDGEKITTAKMLSRDPKIAASTNPWIEQYQQNPEYAGGSGAELMAHIQSGFVDKPKAKMEIYAASRFPDIPLDRAMKRYGADKSGRIYYKAKDGKIYYEDPETFSGKFKALIGKNVAHLPAEAMTLVGVASGVGIPILALLAAGGEGIRKAMGGLLGEDQTTLGNVSDMLIMGGLTVAGELAGRKLLKMVNRFKIKRGGKLAEIIEPELKTLKRDLPDITRRQKIAEKYGLELDISQATESGALQQFRSTLRDMPEGVALREFDIKQAEAVEVAIGKEIANISPGLFSEYQAGRGLRQASRAELDRLETIRRLGTKGLRDRAMSSQAQVDVSEVLEYIDGGIATENKSTVRALKNIRNTLEPMTGEIDNTIKGLEKVKKELDAIIEMPARNTIQKARKIEALKVKKLLLEKMDESVPDYFVYRNIYKAYSEPVDSFKESLLGELLRVDTDRQTIDSIQKILGSKKPELIYKSRAAVERLIKSGDIPKNTWRNASRQHLENLFDGIKPTMAGTRPNYAGGFYKAVMDKKQNAVLKASLTAEQYKNMMNFAETLRLISKTGVKESMTIPRNEQMKIMNKLGMKPVSKSLRAIKVDRPFEFIADFMDGRALARNQREIADAMLSPKAAEHLSRIKRLDPSSEQFIKASSIFFAQILAGNYAEEAPENVAEKVSSLF